MSRPGSFHGPSPQRAGSRVVIKKQLRTRAGNDERGVASHMLQVRTMCRIGHFSESREKPAWATLKRRGKSMGQVHLINVTRENVLERSLYGVLKRRLRSTRDRGPHAKRPRRVAFQNTPVLGTQRMKRRAKSQGPSPILSTTHHSCCRFQHATQVIRQAGERGLINPIQPSQPRRRVGSVLKFTRLRRLSHMPRCPTKRARRYIERQIKELAGERGQCEMVVG